MSTRSLNKVMLIGNLTRDVELKVTTKGTPVATFGMATNRSYTDSTGNQVESAEFTNIVAWSKLAEICEKLLKKGMKVYIEGRLSTTSWDDQATGKKLYRTEVVATDMMILSYPKGMDSEVDSSSTATDNPVSKGSPEDDFDLTDFENDSNSGDSGDNTPF